MSTQTKCEKVQAAADRLRSSERGRAALAALVEWIDEHGAGLDWMNQADVFTVIGAAWGPFSGTARDLMRGGEA
ncbi:MAG: hypothetical protein WEB58_10900 [Planctomycetaceae bacterium]